MARRVDERADAGVNAAHHGRMAFDAAENRRLQMTGIFVGSEPAVVGEIDNQFSALSSMAVEHLP